MPPEAFSPKSYRYAGIALLVAFFSPVGAEFRGSTEFSFLNIEGLGEANVPGLLKFELLYPLIAGVALLAVANRPAGLARAFIILAIALCPFLVLFSSQDVAAGFGRVFTAMGPAGVSLSLLSLAPIGIFAASRARVVRPDNRAAAAVGALAGALYVVALLIPVGPGSGTMPIKAPFDVLLSTGGDGLLALVSGLSIAQMIMMIVAAVLCMMNATTTADAGQRRARHAVNCWLWSLGLGLLSGVLIATRVAQQMPVVLLITMAVKVLLWLGALYFLVLAGVAEILVQAGRPSTVVAAPGTGPRPTITIPAAALDPEERLRRLQQLQAEGLITQEDYDRRKADIISKM